MTGIHSICRQGTSNVDYWIMMINSRRVGMYRIHCTWEFGDTRNYPDSNQIFFNQIWIQINFCICVEKLKFYFVITWLVPRLSLLNLLHLVSLLLKTCGKVWEFVMVDESSNYVSLATVTMKSFVKVAGVKSARKRMVLTIQSPYV